MTWIDYSVLGVMGLSTAWGIWRGLLREIISILGWLIAFLAASLFAGPLSQSMPSFIPGPQLKVISAYVVIFSGSLLLASLAGLLISKLAKAAGLGAMDRSLGALFGALRGILLVLAFALLAGLTALPRQAAWQGSLCGAWLGKTALLMKPWLPQSLSGEVTY